MKRLALVVAATQILVGCAWGQTSSSPPPPRTRPHYPVVVHSPAVVPGHGSSFPALRESAQFVSPTRLGIVTLGSSSCPSVPDKLVVQSPHQIAIHLTVGSRSGDELVAHPPPSGACTADWGTTPMVVPIDPKEIDVHHPLTVHFFYPNSKKPVVRIAAPLKR